MLPNMLWQLTPLCLFFTEFEIDACYYIQLLLLLLEGSTQWSVAEWCEVSLSHSKKPFIKWQGCSKTNRCYTVKQFRSTTLMSCCALSSLFIYLKSSQVYYKLTQLHAGTFPRQFWISFSEMVCSFSCNVPFFIFKKMSWKISTYDLGQFEANLSRL